MSIVQTVLNRTRPPPTAINDTLEEIPSSGTRLFRGFLSRSDALALRHHLVDVANASDSHVQESWVANRKELFNNARVLALAEPVRSIVERCYSRPAALTYNFTSIYVADNGLKRHIDRVGCDVNFLIYLGDDREGAEVNKIISIHDDGLDHEICGYLGDAVLFQGRRMPHFRESDPSAFGMITTILHYDFISA